MKGVPIVAVNIVYAVMPVADFESARAWYERLWGRPADRDPVGGLAEWQINEGGAIQLLHEPDRAGAAMLTLAVDDVAAEVRLAAERGLDLGTVQDTPGGFRTAAVTDPAGNVITLAEEIGPR
ncbi:VOC family protein [Streptomyces chromofuscus]|uniref:VOC family protein n=1 Tax=Streptomyces chromofuscus TaxID=42881 RepID=A0A7M2T2G8_STRCW|nr:VOC family protein [Streptomyces chromofuscus]QOV42095.1 VOC family protein [Streptomyces chromofuscus]GGS85637.1 glyoxalase [Streptomyces chromofuscus]